MEHVKHQVKLQKFNFGKQKSTTSVVPFLSGGLFELFEYSENVQFCLHKIEPLAVSLQPPLKMPHMKTIQEVCKLFPPTCQIEPSMLAAELEIFSTMASEKNPDSVKSAAEFAHEHQLVFPSVSKAYKLLLTAPVSVAKDERTFSKLKIVKNCLRSTMKDERLKDLIVLACEKDLTGTIELQNVVKTWSQIKTRRISRK